MYSHYQYINDPYHYRTSSHDAFINYLQKAINGEFSAISCYEQLAKMAPKSQLNRIFEIINDEKMHLQKFSSIYINMTGKKPTYSITEECPNNYRDGVRFAFNDEQETVDFYLDLADRSNDPYVKEAFRRAAADEQNHAVWFLSFMQ
ncbi:Rubrerythrin [Gracilibacillus orientalis]|uniref:Rubrerythrin n=1 Tax=Gracilibacillus orientalis TaxID=334253 RepID=A0A1I4Q9V3_9BACI|nr:ferritin-like domain-containing protein [Gracilibacillus orientalis]SFM36576.1 Rubrerythrin [Gracilibacillus orientalis]